MNRLRLGRERCPAEIAVTTRSLLGRATRGETVRCRLTTGHESDRWPAPHEGTALEVRRRRAVDVVWKVVRGRGVLLSPDNLVEVI